MSLTPMQPPTFAKRTAPLSGHILDEDGATVTFGTLSRESRQWLIVCEPHVRTRLRRHFPQVTLRPGDVIAITDNQENSRDLLWFVQRYPLQISASDEDHLKSQAMEHIDTELQVHQLLKQYRAPATFELALPPRKYQSEAATLMQLMHGLLIVDDLGLGKSATGICPMVGEGNLPALVVTLSHLTEQWRDEIAKFAPHLKTHILKSAKPYDLHSKPPRGKKYANANLTFKPVLPDVIICNYHKLSGWAEALGGTIAYFIADEVQELRIEDSAKYRAAKYISDRASLRAGLSATPIYNYGREFFSVIECLRPGALGTKEEFLGNWCDSEGRVADPKAFGAHLRREALMLRRTRKDVGRELPPCTAIPHVIGSDSSVLDKIKGSAVELAKLILTNNQLGRGAKFTATQEFNVMMRQATGIAKAPYVAEFVRMILATEQKVILFGWHREVYNIWLEQLAEFKPLLYTGTESNHQKTQAKKEFTEGECRVLIVSLRSGAGLDGLQKICRVGVFGELDWSPGVLEQCAGRYHRDGQEENTFAYYLLAEDGSDPVMADVLGIKRSQIQGVRDPDAELIESLEVNSGGVKQMAAAFLARLGFRSLEHEAGTELDLV